MKPMELAAARYRLGLENGESLCALGESLLTEDGIDAATKLAILNDPEISEAGPIFERVCHELKQPIPSQKEAINIVSAAILHDIANETMDPQAGLRRLMDDIYWPHLAADTSNGRDHYVGESHDLQSLIGAYWSYDELQKRPTEITVDGKYGKEAVALLDQQVKTAARDWLNKYKQP